MPCSLQLAALFALTVVCPAQAHLAHTKADAIKATAQAKGTQTVARQGMSSSKGTRMFAQDPSDSPSASKAKSTVVKSNTLLKTQPVVAVAPLPGTTTPATGAPVPPVHLARLTAYWPQEDPWTAKHESSTGVRLREGVCAVDPKQIPYGSMLQIPGMGNYVACDTGSAVISRQAAVGSAHTEAERNALVVDLFFENRQEAENFAAHGPAYVAVSWTPRSLAFANSSLNNRALPAIPTLPAGAVYVLAQAPSLADCRLPLAFRTPQLAGL